MSFNPEKCPFCLFVPENGLEELAAHLNSCSGRKGWGGIDSFEQYGRANRLADALKSKCVLCKRGDIPEGHTGLHGIIFFTHLLPEGGAHLCTLNEEDHIALGRPVTAGELFQPRWQTYREIAEGDYTIEAVRSALMSASLDLEQKAGEA